MEWSRAASRSATLAVCWTTSWHLNSSDPAGKIFVYFFIRFSVIGIAIGKNVTAFYVMTLLVNQHVICRALLYQGVFSVEYQFIMIAFKTCSCSEKGMLSQDHNCSYCLNYAEFISPLLACQGGLLVCSLFVRLSVRQASVVWTILRILWDIV